MIIKLKLKLKLNLVFLCFSVFLYLRNVKRERGAREGSESA